MKRALATAVVAAALALSGCSAPAATKADDTKTQKALAAFEEDNAIDLADWYGHVTGKEVKLGALWVYTDLSETAAAKEVASGMCGAYAQYVLVDEKAKVTFVRAESGLQLAKCGPGA